MSHRRPELSKDKVASSTTRISSLRQSMLAQCLQCLRSSSTVWAIRAKMIILSFPLRWFTLIEWEGPWLCVRLYDVFAGELNCEPKDKCAFSMHSMWVKENVWLRLKREDVRERDGSFLWLWLRSKSNECKLFVRAQVSSMRMIKARWTNSIWLSTNWIFTNLWKTTIVSLNWAQSQMNLNEILSTWTRQHC